MKPTIKTLKHICMLLGLAAALGMLALAPGCAAKAWQGFPTQAAAGPTWPPAPEEARVAWVAQIRSQQDLFATGGTLRKLGELIAGKADTTLVRPFAIAMHPQGGLLVADPGRPCVMFYNWAIQRTIQIGPKRRGGLPSPVGVVALPDGRVLVSDSRLGTVEMFDADGRYEKPFCAAGVLKRPAGLAVSAQRGEVYAIDVTGHCIKVFSLSGAPLRTIGRHGDGQGEFNFPTHLVIDAQGRLVVTDSLNFRVQTLTPEGAFVAGFGEMGDRPGKFAKPKGIAVDGAGNIVVVEGIFDALQFFDGQGRLLLSVGTSGHGPGEFWLPAGVCYDAKEGLMFVADSYNKRIQVFRLLGAASPQPAGVKVAAR